jgi:hypothetical protein
MRVLFKLSINHVLLLIFLVIQSIFVRNLFSQSDQFEQFEYISPQPGSRFVLPNNNITIRYGELIDQSTLIKDNIFKVYGSSSGSHSGEIVLSDDNLTLIFLPEYPFSLGESVSVELHEELKTLSGKNIPQIKFSFTITSMDENLRLKYLNKHYYQEYSAKNAQNIYSDDLISNDLFEKVTNDSLPDEFPNVSVSVLNNPSTDYLFVSFYRLAGPYYGPSFVSIIDNFGTPIYYQKIKRMATDVKVQPNGLLSYFEGPANVPQRYYYLLDQSYTLIDSFCTGNGYFTDLHEFRLLTNNHALLLSYDPQFVRMDTIVPGGNPNAVVIGLIIQELDASKNVIFQWRSWDHYEITDVDSNISLTDSIIDYVHGNALEVDFDGHLLFCSRNMNEITKINRQTGDIIWRWGGEKNEFIFINYTRGFSRQHHIRRLDNGNYTIYDNGNYLHPQYSTALEYHLDQYDTTATLVWSYRDTDVYSPFMGSVQRLVNGNTLIGWGATFGTLPALTEVRPDGTKELELIFETPFITYRAKRFPWKTNLLSTSLDTLIFINPIQIPDTAGFDLINHSSHDIQITTASSRTSNFSVINSLPIFVPSQGIENILIKFLPTENILYKDVLTLRVDLDSTGYGCQVHLFAENLSGGLKNNYIVHSFELYQNYPNPFNPSTTIEFDLPKSGEVSLKVFNILGEEVATLVSERLSTGSYSYEWDASNLASGIYLYRLQAGDYVETRKMVLMR